MFRVGAKTYVGSGNLKHKYILFWPLIGIAFFQYIFPHFLANVTTICSRSIKKCLGSGQKPRKGREPETQIYLIFVLA